MVTRQLFTLFALLVIAGSLSAQIQKKEKKEIIIKSEADGDGRRIVIVNGDTVNVDQYRVEEFRMEGPGRWQPGLDRRPIERFQQRPKLGVQVQEQENEKGLKVITVMGGTPAENAGIKNKDVILMVDEKEVNTVDELRKLLSEKKETVSITLLREGKKTKVDVRFPKPLKKGVV